jgi:hypothetical protein
MRKALKNALLSALAVVALAAAGLGYNHYREGQPYLVGHCFVAKGEPLMLAVAETQVLKDRDGKDAEVYLTVVVIGPMQIPGPILKIRDANRELGKAVKEGKLMELNCETGEEIK